VEENKVDQLEGTKFSEGLKITAFDSLKKHSFLLLFLDLLLGWNCLDLLLDCK